MKTHAKELRLGIYVLASIILGLSASVSARAQTTALRSLPTASSGRETFTQYCSICHGVGAQGFIGPRIAGINFGPAGLQTIVRHGLGGYGGMPAFSRDSVSDQHLEDVQAYLISLGPPPAEAASGPSVVASGPAQPISTKASSASKPASGVPSPAAAGVAGVAQAHGTNVASTVAGAMDGDATRGIALFGTNCASCHGAGGKGGFGPVLKNEKSRKNFAAAVAWIKNPTPPMPKLYPTPLSEQNVRDIAAYIETL